MNPLPIVSVIVPIYNAAETLQQCVDSILSQTTTYFELLLIDDGSIDESLEICNRYASKDFRVKTWHKQNGGVCSARNFGLDKATGKYVCFADADDYVANTWLENLVNGVELNPEVLVLSNVQIVEPHKYYIRYPDQSGLYEIEEIWRLGDWGYSVNKIYRKDIINKYSLRYDESLRVYEDELFIARYCAAMENVYIIPTVGYYYVLSNQFENKYLGDLNLNYMVYQYCEVKKYNKRCSDYLVDRLIMIAYRHIIDHKGSFNSVVSLIKTNVGRDIQFVHGKRKALMRKLSGISSSFIWKAVFRFYVTFRLI